MQAYLREVMIGLTLLVSVLTFVIGDSETLERMPQSVHLEHTRPRARLPGFHSKECDGFVYNRLIQGVADDGVAFVGLCEEIRLHPAAYSAAIPGLREGDILPIVRGVYQITSVNSGTLTSAQVRCKLLESPPAGVYVTPGTYPYPFRPVRNEYSDIVHCELHDTPFRGTFVPAQDDQPSAVDVVVFERTGRSSQLQGAERKEVKSTLKVGDLLTVSNRAAVTVKHRLVHIVPPDPEKRVIGWFEINIEPESEAPQVK